MKAKLVLCLFAVAAATSFGVVVGDFEGSMDGWVMQNAATGTFSSDGATLGSNSLQVGFGSGWITVLKLDVLDKASDLDELQSISLDLTTRNDNGQLPGWWLQTEIVFNTQNSGWQQSGNLLPGISWSPKTDVLSWTIPQSIRDVLAASGPGGYAEIFVVMNTSGAANTVWVDNVQMAIPEPATMLMLGLGGVLSLIRKR